MPRSGSGTALGVIAGASWLLIVAGILGCSGDAARHFVELDDGAYLRGEQVATLDLSKRLGSGKAERAELFLDGQRVAADDFAPFELRWTTLDFPDGEYQLLARVHLDDGGPLDDELSIRIDNTPPTLDNLADVAVQDQLVIIPAHDNFEVARVEISRGLVGEPPLIVSAPPFSFQWKWSCGPVPLQIRVLDRAGSEITRSFTVSGIENQNDRDCDQHPSRATGGDDCDDTDPSTHPGALEYNDTLDRNCDNVHGLPVESDADGDGVASFASGGADCNDANPAIHGNALVLGHSDLTVDGQPLTWPAGGAVLGSGDPWQLLLNNNGIVESVRPGLGDVLSITQMATDANAASIAATRSLVAFGRGNQLVIQEPTGTGSMLHSVIQTDAPVGRVALAESNADIVYAVYQAGTKVYFASWISRQWTTQMLVDADAPLVEAPVLWAGPYGADVVFRTANIAWKAGRSGVTDPLTTNRFGPPGLGSTTASSAYTNILAFVAVDHGTGSALYNTTSSVPVMYFPRRITGLFIDYPRLFVHLDGFGTQVLLTSDNYRRVQLLPDGRAFDTANGAAFAGSGHVDYATTGSISAPFDNSGDNVDLDCDGRDD